LVKSGGVFLLASSFSKSCLIFFSNLGFPSTFALSDKILKSFIIQVPKLPHIAAPRPHQSKNQNKAVVPPVVRPNPFNKTLARVVLFPFFVFSMAFITSGATFAISTTCFAHGTVLLSISNFSLLIFSKVEIAPLFGINSPFTFFQSPAINSLSSLIFVVYTSSASLSAFNLVSITLFTSFLISSPISAVCVFLFHSSL
jgi:hypothetical protein